MTLEERGMVVSALKDLVDALYLDKPVYVYIAAEKIRATAARYKEEEERE